LHRDIGKKRRDFTRPNGAGLSLNVVNVRALGADMTRLAARRYYRIDTPSIVLRLLGLALVLAISVTINRTRITWSPSSG
jgi:hypothetical protein